MPAISLFITQLNKFELIQTGREKTRSSKIENEIDVEFFHGLNLPLLL